MSGCTVMMAMIAEPGEGTHLVLVSMNGYYRCTIKESTHQGLSLTDKYEQSLQ